MVRQNAETPETSDNRRFQMSTVSGFPTNNSSVGVEQSGKGGGDAFGNSTSTSGAVGGAASAGGAAPMGMGGGFAIGGGGAAPMGMGGGFAIGGGATGGDATSDSSAFGALGGDVSDNTSIGTLTINS